MLNRNKKTAISSTVSLFSLKENPAIITATGGNIVIYKRRILLDNFDSDIIFSRLIR